MDDASSVAAFYRVEGTLVRRPVVGAAAWLAANSQRLRERTWRLGSLAMAVPARVAPLSAGALSARMLWMGTRGMSEDRLVELGREYYERFIQPNLVDVGTKLVLESRRQGRRVVLVTEYVECVIGPLVDELQPDDLLCNRLEIGRGQATGRLVDPVIGPSFGATWVRRYAAGRRIDLARSYAYGARAADSLMLSAIGQPCAVQPDWMLRRIAKDQDWPVVDS